MTVLILLILPIALISWLSKVFESILTKKILKHLSLHNLLSDRQYGFRQGRSTGDLVHPLLQILVKLLL